MLKWLYHGFSEFSEKFDNIDIIGKYYNSYLAKQINCDYSFTYISQKQLSQIFC